MKEKYINLEIKKYLKNNNKTIINFFFFFLYLVFEQSSMARRGLIRNFSLVTTFKKSASFVCPLRNDFFFFSKIKKKRCLLKNWISFFFFSFKKYNLRNEYNIFLLQRNRYYGYNFPVCTSSGLLASQLK